MLAEDTGTYFHTHAINFHTHAIDFHTHALHVHQNIRGIIHRIRPSFEVFDPPYCFEFARHMHFRTHRKTHTLSHSLRPICPRTRNTFPPKRGVQFTFSGRVSRSMKHGVRPCFALIAKHIHFRTHRAQHLHEHALYFPQKKCKIHSVRPCSEVCDSRCQDLFHTSCTALVFDLTL